MSEFAACDGIAAGAAWVYCDMKSSPVAEVGPRGDVLTRQPEDVGRLRTGNSRRRVFPLRVLYFPAPPDTEKDVGAHSAGAKKPRCLTGADTAVASEFLRSLRQTVLSRSEGVKSAPAAAPGTAAGRRSHHLRRRHATRILTPSRQSHEVSRV